MAKINTATLTKVEVELPLIEEDLLENITVTPVEDKDKLVEVFLKANFRAYLGDGWIDLGKGRQRVPEYVKAHLLAVKMLEAL